MTTITNRDSEAGIWTDLLAAFERLFSIGVLYPEGHARCVNVATEFQKELRRALAGGTVLTIDATRDALAIEDCLVAGDSRGAKRIQRIMTTLGISRLEIETTATPADVYALVKLLLRLMHEAESTHGFRRLEFDGVPATVRLSFREFSQQSETPGESASAIQPRTAAGIGVVERGFDLETREAVGGLVQNLALHAVHEAPARSAPAGGQPDGAGPTGAKATGAAPTATKPGGSQGVAGAAGEPAAAGEAAKSGDPAGPPCAEEAAPAPECRLGLAELQRRLAASADEVAPRPNLSDRAEQIGTLAQLLLHGGSAAALDGIVDLLGQCLMDPPRERELQVLQGVLSELLGSADEALVDRALPGLMRPLRAAGALGAALAGSIAPGVGVAAWPHVVNELLVGLEHADEAAFRSVALAVAALPQESMRSALPRLARLDAMREHRLSPRLFRLPLREFAGLFSLLLGSPAADAIGPWLLEQLRAHPLAWAGAPALWLIGDYGPGNRTFLVRLLREMSRGETSRELLVTAVQIIARGVRALPPAQRAAPWVPKAVRALGEAPTPGGNALLASIRKERRLLVLRAWPAACRRAAEQAQRAAYAVAPTPAEGGPGA